MNWLELMNPSRDLFFADKTNLKHIEKVSKGKMKKLSKEGQNELLGL